MSSYKKEILSVLEAGAGSGPQKVEIMAGTNMGPSYAPVGDFFLIDWDEVKFEPIELEPITIFSYDPYEISYVSVPKDVNDLINVDVEYLKNVFEVLNIDELKYDLIQFSFIRSIYIVENEIRLRYSYGAMDEYGVAENINLLREDYIKLNQLVLEKTIPKATAKNCKPLKF